MLKDAPASDSDWDEGSAGRARGPSPADPTRDIISLRAPARETPPATERPAKPGEKTERPTEPAEPAEKEAERGPKPAAQEEKPGQSPRGGWLRRHPVLAPVSLMALFLAAAAGYLYWDHTAHFELTDDAFIAARQFAIAPQVAGYVTAVPVTDNQHVDTGGVIAQIDQRDYRAALAQADAQVAGAEAGIHNIDAQMATQDAQVTANQAQVAPSAGEPGTLEGHLGTRQAARQSGLGDGSAGHDRRPNSQGPAGLRRERASDA